MQDLNCVFEGLDGKGAIFISTIHAARNISLLKKHNIGAVLSIARGAYTHYNKEQVTHYLYLPADDISSYNLSQHFEQTHTFIETARKSTNVLIHCMAGISRSATITAAYLMRKFGYSLEKVLKHIQRKRTKIYPNPGFMKQLAALENQLAEQKKQKQFMANSTGISRKKEKPEKYSHSRSPSASPKFRPAKSITPPTSVDKDTNASKQRSIKQMKNSINLVEVPQIDIRPSPKLARSQSTGISYKIDRIKSSLIIKGKMQLGSSTDGFSPCKGYSPLVYKNRPKLLFTNY